MILSVGASTMPAVTLTEFLLERYAEEEAAARAATPGPWRYVASVDEAASAAQWCYGTVVEDNGHTAGKHCWGGPDGTDTEYRVQAKFCGPSGCFWAYGQWKDFGALGRSKAHSDYATFNGDIYINTR